MVIIPQQVQPSSPNITPLSSCGSERGSCVVWVDFELAEAESEILSF